MISSSLNLKAMITQDSICSRTSHTQEKSWNSTAFIKINSTRFFPALWHRKSNQKAAVSMPSFDIYSDVQAYVRHDSIPFVGLQEAFDSVNLSEHLRFELFRIIFFCIDLVLLLQRCVQLYRQTQSMFIGFKCRTVLSPSQFWRLRLAAELSSNFNTSVLYQSKSKQADDMASFGNETKGVSDGVLLVTKPTSDLAAYNVMCDKKLSVKNDNNYCSRLYLESNSGADLETSKSGLYYCSLLFQSVLLRRIESAILVVLLLYFLLASVNHILLSFAGCYPQMAVLYKDLINASEFLSVSSWQHLIQLTHEYKSHELSEFYVAVSRLHTFVEEELEMKSRSYWDEVCFLFPNGHNCNASVENEPKLHHFPRTGVKFPCSYGINQSHLSALPEFNVTCVLHLSLIARSTEELIAAFWQVLITCTLLIVVLHAVGVLTLHCVKERRIFPVRYVYETSSSGLSHPSSLSHAKSSRTSEKSEAVNCRLELPAVYRIISSTTPETSPSPDAHFTSLSRRSRVRFAPTVQISSAGSSFGSIPTQMQVEVGYAESNV